MRGYLHRLANAAVAPQARLHPFVESTYAAPVREESEAPVPRHETRVAEVRANPGEARVEEAGSADSTQPTEARAGRTWTKAAEVRVSRSEAALEAAGRKAAGFEPLIESRRDAAATDAGSAAYPRNEPASPAPVRASDALAERLPERKTEESSSTMASDEPRPAGPIGRAAEWEFQPIVAEQRAEPEFPEHRIVRAPAAAAGERQAGEAGLGDGIGSIPRNGGRRVAGNGSGRRVDGQRAAEVRAEDIQIHIGRIEVVAMPPQVARAPAPPARKTLSLDDYLRGRAQ